MKRYISALTALCLTLALALPAEAGEAAGFRDVPAGFWAWEQISRCVGDGIVSGYDDGTFRPAGSVSYGAFSLMLARAFYPGELNGSSSPAAGEAVMNRHGILQNTARQSGAGSGTAMTREDMAQCMYNILADQGAKTPSNDEYLKSMDSISDFYSISSGCRRAVMVCCTLGLLGGQKDGSFGPRNSMNRGQGCVVINRLRDYMGKPAGTAGDPVDPSDPAGSSETPEMTDGPLFKMLEGENAQQMMDRINASTTCREGYLTNGKPITEDNIKELLAKFEETMPTGSPWDDSSTFNYQSRSFGFTKACSSFAAAVSDSLFGGNAPITRHQNFDQLKVGDVVWLKNSATGYYHAVVVTSMTPPSGHGPSDYTICDGNNDESWDSSGGVKWGAAEDRNAFNLPEITSGTYIYSRY